MDRLTILERIYSCFYCVRQWANMFDYARANEYANKAEELIKLLEVYDCGSCGGHDKHNKLVHTTNYKLYNRFLTLLNKKHTDIFTSGLTKYFTDVTY